MSNRGDFYYLRILATGASFTLFGLGGLVLGYLIFPLVSLLSPDRRRATLRCRKLVQLSFRAFIWFMETFGVLTWEISGRGRLSRPGQLIVANHPTLIDIVFIIAMIPNANCIVKPSLYRNPFTRGPVSRAGYIASEDPGTLVDACVESLASGASLVIFPEGTRSVRGQPMRFRRGAAYVQLRSGCPVSLAVIESCPPTLAKHEKWYEIPATRPHFRLDIRADMATAVEVGKAAGDARVLTRRWSEYFSSEVLT